MAARHPNATRIKYLYQRRPVLCVLKPWSAVFMWVCLWMTWLSGAISCSIEWSLAQARTQTNKYDTGVEIHLLLDTFIYLFIFIYLLTYFFDIKPLLKQLSERGDTIQTNRSVSIWASTHYNPSTHIPSPLYSCASHPLESILAAT